MNNNFENGIESVRALESLTVGHGSIASQPTPIEHKINNFISCNCNKPIIVKIKKDNEFIITPEQKQDGDVGFDFYVPLNTDRIKLIPNEEVFLDTGISVELPKGYFMQIHVRSSIGIKKNLILKNLTGIIDEGYRQSIKICLRNIGKDVVVIENNERLVQGIILPYPKVKFEVVEELSETNRNFGGIGSSNSL